MTIISLKKVLKVHKAYKKLNDAERQEFHDMIGVRVRFEELIQEWERRKEMQDHGREGDD